MLANDQCNSSVCLGCNESVFMVRLSSCLDVLFRDRVFNALMHARNMNIHIKSNPINPLYKMHKYMEINLKIDFENKRLIFRQTNVTFIIL